MAKKRRRKKPTNQQHYVSVKRDNTLIRRRDEDIINDRRRWLPENDDLPRRDDGKRVNFRGYDDFDDEYRPKSADHITGRIAFRNPKRVTLCQRRKTRRSVLHALRKTGKGTGMGKKKFNRYSRIVCKRR